jgi:branched-chain amino acid transport system ATP-binding protein
VIDVDRVTVQFGGVFPLDDLTLQLDGSIVGIVGPNGAGKTTLLNVMSGFVTPKQGSITVDGTDILAMAPYKRARWGIRRTFQTEQVVNELTVRDNVSVMLDTARLSSSERTASIERALEITGLDQHADRSAHALNAFERRLVELARAVVGTPKVIMMDEPAAGLSNLETAELRATIANLPAATSAMVVLIDHDVELIAAICENTAVLDFGELIAYGPTAASLSDPKVRAAYLGVALEEA